MTSPSIIKAFTLMGSAANSSISTGDMWKGQKIGQIEWHRKSRFEPGGVYLFDVMGAEKAYIPFHAIKVIYKK